MRAAFHTVVCSMLVTIQLANTYKNFVNCLLGKLPVYMHLCLLKSDCDVAAQKRFWCETMTERFHTCYS